MPTRLAFGPEVAVPPDLMQPPAPDPVTGEPTPTPTPDAKIDVEVTISIDRDARTVVVKVPAHDLATHQGLVAIHVCFRPDGVEVTDPADAIARYLSGTERFEDDGTERTLSFPIKPLTGHPDPTANLPADFPVTAVSVLEFTE